MNSQEETGDRNSQETKSETPYNLPTTALSPTTTGIGVVTSTTGNTNAVKRRKVLVARPFGSMRGHTAFLTFATAGNTKQPNPLGRKEMKENDNISENE